MIDLLAWRPFIDPIDLHRVWFVLLVPMSFLISVAYKGVRLADLRGYWRKVMFMTVQVVVGMISLGLGFFVLVQYVLPRLAP